MPRKHTEENAARHETALEYDVLKSKLFLKTYAGIIVCVLAFTGVSYLSSVPWLRNLLERQEERTGRVVLDNVYELASSAHQEIQAWQESALRTRRHERRNLLQLVEAGIHRLEAKIAAQNLNAGVATTKLLESIRHTGYDQDNDYVDNLEEEVAARKAIFTERLRRHLHETRIADSGYLFVFDSDHEMVIHPNPNIEGTNVRDLLNPISNRSLSSELMTAAETPDGRVVYKWDKPSDPGNYIYDKVSWVRYLPEFDWYIASSVYRDELQRTGDQLTARILFIAGLILIVTFIGAYFFLRRIITPISRLAETATRVGDGELSASSDIDRNDEIGILAKAINTMIARLRDQFHNLEHRVAERTTALAQTVRSLEDRSRENAELTSMGERLLSCSSEKQVFAAVTRTSQALFPHDAGRAYLADSNGQLQLSAQWGDNYHHSPDDGPDPSCSAFRLGKAQRHVPTTDHAPCRHCQDEGVATLCMPLQTEDAMIGIIKLIPATERDKDMNRVLGNRQPLMTTVVEHAALTVTNLRLRERLREQSIKDSLTGLFNRRRLEEVLASEISRVQRHGGQVGIVMLDVDHFKRFNDCYGHDIGDKVLSKVGELLRSTVRREDIACRYGGEEFTLIIPEANKKGLRTLAELVRSRIEALDLPELAEKVTVSAGTALYPSHGHDVHSLLKAADIALYEAKQTGRNRIIDADEVPPGLTPNEPS